MAQKKFAGALLLAIIGTYGVDANARASAAAGAGSSLAVPGAASDVLPQSVRSGIDALLKTHDRPSEPGCAVGVYRSGKVLYAGAYGLADLGSKQGNTPQTSINIGSVAKQFTAAGIVLLAQEGKLSLDDDVRKYVPELPDLGQPITIRRLLTHTSGMRDYRGLLNLAGHRNHDIVRAPRILQILSLQRGLNFSPGEQVMYGNGGYFLAGLVIERISGLPFHTFMRRRLFEPLGMTRTRFKGDTNGLPALAAHHAPSGDGRFVSLYEQWEEDGPGDLYSTIEDLALWDANFQTAKLGGRHLVEALETRARLNDGQDSDYALGLRYGTMHGHNMIGHTGVSEGSVASYQRFPEADLSVVALCNRTDGPEHKLVSGIAALVLPPKPAGPPSFLAQYAGLPSAPAGTWSGTYNALGNAAVVTVRAEDEGLTMELGGGKYPLKPIGGDVYQVIGGPADTYGRFVAATGEEPRKLVPLNSDDAPMVAFEQARPTTRDLVALAGDYQCPEFEAVIRMSVAKGKLLAHIPPMPAEAMLPLGRNQFTMERLVFTFDDAVAGASPGFRLDQWRARGMRCHRRTGAS